VDGKECIPIRGVATVTLGGEELRNSSSEPVVLDGVSLDNGQRLSVTEALVVPIAGNTLLGFWNHYPPDSATSSPQSRAIWNRRARVLGYIMAPGAVLNLVLAARYPGGGDASASRITVSYHQGNKRYAYGLKTAYVLKSACF
jgi:hypothetical protein